jgi:HTH-type transcriptional regulator/antitoxin HigA
MAVASTTMPPSYFALVRKFPLVRIRDDAHLEGALAVVDDLLRRDLDAGAQEYLDALTQLIEVYEAQAVPIPDARPADLLRLLMQSNDVTQAQLAKAINIAQSTVSAILNGEREPTRSHIAKLAHHFGVSPAAFYAGTRSQVEGHKRTE